MKVKATGAFERYHKSPVELKGKIPKAGDIFDMTPQRFWILNGHNKYGVKFVVDVRTKLEDQEPTPIVFNQQPVEEVYADNGLCGEDDIPMEVVNSIQPKKTRKKKTD